VQLSLREVAILATKPKKGMSKLLGDKKENFAEKWCPINEACYEKSKAQRHICSPLRPQRGQYQNSRSTNKTYTEN
jgi:hypothetical protein